MQLTDIRTLLQAELHAVDALIGKKEAAHVDIVNSLTSHVADAGGKRLRPLVLLLTAKAFDYQGQHHITLATALELVHTASLLHDDVVDKSTLRRGHKTANEIWGNTASVLVGDFLYSRAFDLTISLENTAIMKAVAQGTHLVAEGEIMQLMHKHNFNKTLEDALTIIALKTGKLFELASELGALLACPSRQQAAKDYGLNLGIGFQIIDDMLDYQGDLDQIGKNVGDDLKNGSLTLPLLHVLQHGNTTQVEWVKQAVQQTDVNIDLLQQAMRECGTFEYAQQLADAHIAKAKQALNEFPQNQWTEGLTAIADFAIARNH